MVKTLRKTERSLATGDMRWRGDSFTMLTRVALLVALVTIGGCDGTRRRTAQRRKDTLPGALYEPAPSAESLSALALSMGAAGFEHQTEGRTLVKRLIPSNTQPDLDVVEHQGVIGKAGVDFPAFPSIPNTGFNCKNVPTGYYADLETDCQVFHICDTSRKISFLCPNGTIFSQSHLICDWWFKVDCASSPALYESSAEYYSNEQKKTHKITHHLSRSNTNLQQIEDSNRAESRRTSVNVPSTTERLLRHRQRLQQDQQIPKATSRSSFQSLYTELYNPTQRTYTTSSAFEKRRKNLVQLVGNSFNNPPAKTTPSTYSEPPSFRTQQQQAGDNNNIREMQVAAETASFTNNNNRQFLQDYNKNFRPYPVYTPNLTARQSKTKSNPTLTTLYDIRDKKLNQVTYDPTTTKRPTLVPYTKSYYSSTYNDKREPYTRPGVSLLKDFIEKEKNKTTTETVPLARKVPDAVENRVTIETKDTTYESVTKIPLTTKTDFSLYTQKQSTDRFDNHPVLNEFATIQQTDSATDSYQERRDRLMRKLNLDSFAPSGPTEATSPTTPTEKFYGDLPNRPGLVVPPSLTPKTLHSLAIYYATALDNLSTNQPSDYNENQNTTPVYDEYENQEDRLPALFSQHTINKYSNLFAQGHNNKELLEELKLDPNGTYNELTDDLAVQQSQNPIATSPQIRELAQVFTHALSAYLQDPVQFRKVLSDIRPTHPTFTDMGVTEEYNTEPTTTINEDDDEILGFSDDNKVGPVLASLRDGKSLNLVSEYSTIGDEITTTPRPYSTEFVSTTPTTTFRNIFRCCGRISASYTSASTERESSTTPIPFKQHTGSGRISKFGIDTPTTTENSYAVPKYAGFQNNTLDASDSPYGKELNPTEAKPLTEYVEVTNLPTAWGVDATSYPVTNPQSDGFESKKIRTTTQIPETTQVYFTETDSIELENDDELQRAQSQSFVTPQNNNLRQGKQINFEETKTTVKKPSEDLEAPTLPDIETTTNLPTTTTQLTTTLKIEDSVAFTSSPVASSIFTSPDGDKTTNYQWESTFQNWHSTVVDPITLNDGLSQTEPDASLSYLSKQNDIWANTNTATTPGTEYTKTSEPVYSSSIHVELTTPGSKTEERQGRLVKEFTSTESAQDLTTIADTVAEKAKELMNATTAEKLMNVMKKTKSKTVKRLILLLVQTCDDDHNTTAEASKKALLEALMAVSQKDMDEIAKEEGVTDLPTTAVDFEVFSTSEFRKTHEEKQETNPRSERRGKSINFDASAINALSNPTTTEAVPTTEYVEVTTTQAPRTTTSKRRGAKRFFVRPTTVEFKTTIAPFNDIPKAEARVAAQPGVKTTSDTRALELLRSLYTIAAKWG